MSKSVLVSQDLGWKQVEFALAVDSLITLIQCKDFNLQPKNKHLRLMYRNTVVLIIKGLVVQIRPRYFIRDFGETFSGIPFFV